MRTNKTFLIILIFASCLFNSCDDPISKHLKNNQIEELKKNLEGISIVGNCDNIKIISVDIDPSEIETKLTGQDIKGKMRIGNTDAYMDWNISMKFDLTDKSKNCIFLENETEESIKRRLNNFVISKWFTLFPSRGNNIELKLRNNGDLIVKVKDRDYEGSYTFNNIRQKGIENHINIEQIRCENLRTNLDIHSPVFYGSITLRWSRNGDDYAIESDFKTSSEGLLLINGKGKNRGSGEVFEIDEWKMSFN